MAAFGRYDPAAGERNPRSYAGWGSAGRALDTSSDRHEAWGGLWHAMGICWLGREDLPQSERENQVRAPAGAVTGPLRSRPRSTSFGSRLTRSGMGISGHFVFGTSHQHPKSLRASPKPSRLAQGIRDLLGTAWGGDRYRFRGLAQGSDEYLGAFRYGDSA